MFILVNHLASEQNICRQEAGLKLLQREGVRLVADTLETDDSIAANAVDEGKDARQDLNLEFDDEERGIFDVDAEEAGIEVFGRKCLL